MKSTTARPTAAATALDAEIDAAREEARRPLDRAEVADIVASVLHSMEGDVSSIDLKLYAELEALARYIQHAKREIAQIRPDDLAAQHIPSAAGELDAVVGATEDATNRIMDACDVIQAVADGLDEQPRGILVDAITGIFEACNFQDVTGQRITKVVRTLKHIEQKIETLVEVLGEEVSRTRAAESGTAESGTAESGTAESGSGFGPATPADDDRHLVNGPQLPGQGIDQSEIDRLLASFD